MPSALIVPKMVMGASVKRLWQCLVIEPLGHCLGERGEHQAQHELDSLYTL